MVKCFIGIGKCSNFYKYIFGCVCFNAGQYFIIHYFESALKNKQLIQSIYKHLGFIFFGFLFFLLFKYNGRVKKRYNVSNKKIQKSDDSNIQLIYNDNVKNVVLSNIDICTLILIAVNYILFNESLKILNYLGFYSIEFWTVEIIFLLLLTYYYFPNTIYRHQIFSMIIIIIINTGLLIFYFHFFDLFFNVLGLS